MKIFQSGFCLIQYLKLGLLILDFTMFKYDELIKTIYGLKYTIGLHLCTS